MDTFPVELERQAMRNQPLPRKIDIADSCAYEAFRYLYLMYHAGMISKEKASEEKQRIIYNWVTAKSMVIALYEGSEIVRQHIGDASENYRKNPTIENADKMYGAFYRLGDNWRNEMEAKEE